jgi:AhpD family alkylhydroperoxidase
MTTFAMHTLESAPVDAKETLTSVKKAFGTIPNLQAVMAESPELLKAQQALWALFDQTSFDALEKQVVYLTTIYENECSYCMAGHTMLAKMQHLPEDVVTAIREGRPIADAKLQALRSFTSKMVTSRGWASEADVAVFLAAGYTQKNVLEVILGIATKVTMNYVNHVAGTPNDAFMKGFEWTPPRARTKVA